MLKVHKICERVDLWDTLTLRSSVTLFYVVIIVVLLILLLLDGSTHHWPASKAHVLQSDL